MNILIWGIYLIVFCLPMYLVRFKIFNIPTNVLEAMIGVLFILWLFKGGFKGIKKDLKRFKGVFLPIILILIGVSITTIFSWDLRTSAGIWKGWFVVPLIFFVVLVSVMSNPKDKPTATPTQSGKQAGPSKCEAFVGVFYSLIASGFIVSIISLIYLIQGNLDNQGRLQGIYNSPNYLAMYLTPILLVSFGYYFFTFFAPTCVGAQGLTRGFRTRSETTSKIFILLNTILLLVILFFTKSIGAWLGIITAFCFGLAVFFYKQKKPAQGWSASGRKRVLFLIIVLGLLIILLLGLIKTSVLPLGKSSFNARLLFWQKAWQIFKQYPFIGIGPGTFQDYFPLYPKWGVPQPHNLYLAFLLQTGIIGFIGFIWLLVWFYWTGIKDYLASRMQEESGIMNIILLATMTYVLTHGLVDTWYWKNDLAVMFWLFAGLMAIIPVLSNKASH